MTGIVRKGNDETKMICGCFDFTIADIHRTLDENLDLKFQEFLDYTGIGGKCTACLLDAEYHFVDHSSKRKSGSETQSSRKSAKKPGAQKSLKQRLYGLLDAISPNVPYLFENPMPVLYGPGIEQWVQIVNRSMLFEKEVYAADMDVTLTLRDTSGTVVKTISDVITKDDILRVNLSEILQNSAPLEPGKDIGIGWVKIHRRGKISGVRGTTRPQVEIVTPGGTCAVHSQAYTGPGTNGFSALCRPSDERLFLSFVNPQKSDLNVKLKYPLFIKKENDAHQAEEVTILVPSKNVVLHEIDLEKYRGTPRENKLMDMLWTTDGTFKAHLFCASKSLDRFSIDHV